ncbi:MAG: hypothetical protein JWR37_5762 [Mycobacterium sp.]|nr:hypothetical protein [Mycobacterium sp.]
MKRLTTVVAVGVALLGGCTGNSGPSVDQSAAAPSRPADEQAALDAVAPACQEDPEKLDAEAKNAAQILAERGVNDETVVTMLRHLRQSIPDSAPVLPCVQNLAVYIQLRAPGT